MGENLIEKAVSVVNHTTKLLRFEVKETDTEVEISIYEINN